MATYTPSADKHLKGLQAPGTTALQGRKDVRRKADPPPFFHRRKFPSVGGNNREVTTKSQDRGSHRYGHRWNELSVKFRKSHPFCLFCEQEGFECSPVEEVDHIIPLRWPFSGKKFDWSNLQSLCQKHHFGLKARLEAYAERNEVHDLLPVWCADPSQRPDMTKRRL